MDALEEQRHGEVCRILTEMLELWEAMKHSEMEDAGDDADRFQTKFYLFMDYIREWIRVMGRRPEDATAAQSMEYCRYTSRFWKFYPLIRNKALAKSWYVE